MKDALEVWCFWCFLFFVAFSFGEEKKLPGGSVFVSGFTFPADVWGSETRTEAEQAEQAEPAEPELLSGAQR